MKRSIFGLDISDSSVEVATLSQSVFKQPRLEAYGRVNLRSGIVAQGIIKKPEQLGAAILEALATAEPRAINRCECILALPDSKVFTTVLKFPSGLRRDEIKNTIPYTVEEIVPFKDTEIYYDFKTITRHDTSQEVLYVGVPADVVDSYIALLGSIGIIPVAFEFESLSLLRAVVPHAQQSKKNVDVATPAAWVVVDIGGRATNILIYDRLGVRRLATVRVAGDQITRRLAEAAGLRPAQAETLKRKIGLGSGKTDAEKVVRPLIEEELQSVVEIIQKTVEDYQHDSGRTVGELILAGGTSLLPKIDDFFEKATSLTVRRGNPFVNVDDAADILKPKSKGLLFANVLGLSLRGLHRQPAHQDINLLPPLERSWRATVAKVNRPHGSLLRWVGGLILCGVVAVGISAIYQISKSPDFFGLSSTQPASDIVEPIDEPSAFQVISVTSTTTPQLITIGRSTSTIPIWQSATTTASILGRVAASSTLKLISQRAGWYEVGVTASSTGWITADVGKVIVPLLSAQPSVNSNVLGSIKIEPVDLGHVNVRTGPAVSNQKIGEAPVGAQYPYLKQEAGWYQIQFTTTSTGWVIGTYATTTL